MKQRVRVKISYIYITDSTQGKRQKLSFVTGRGQSTQKSSSSTQFYAKQIPFQKERSEVTKDQVSLTNETIFQFL